jgi:hypothetical protein
MAPRLDEDGRCILTGLLPEHCACKDHRNSPELVELDMSSLVVLREMEALYNGRCAVDPQHGIRPGDAIGLVTQADTREPVGWACELCTEGVKARARRA